MITTNAAETAKALTREGREFRTRVLGITNGYADKLQQKVKANAASAWHPPGRPHIGGYTGEGPNVATSKYQNSIKKEVLASTTIITAAVGTDAPQGRRLELGFHGADSLGRRYSQDPLPHFGPALDDLTVPFMEAVGEAVAIRATK